MTRILFACLLCVLAPVAVAGKALTLTPEMKTALAESPQAFIEQYVADPYPFFGLATYLNSHRLYLFNDDELLAIENPGEHTLSSGQWLAVSGRLKVLLIAAPGLTVRHSPEAIEWQNSSALLDADAQVLLLNKDALATQGQEVDTPFDQLRYQHLWRPLATLSRAVEYTLVSTRNMLDSSWGLAIFLVAVLIRLLLLPFTRWTSRMQANVNEIQATLEPQLAEIRRNFDGEQAHNRLMDAHKAMGVSPFYTLKPMLATAIQLPVLIAVFNALAEMPQLAGQSMAWVTDLAYPDNIATLPLTLPFMGNTLNLLPLIMTLATLAATLTFHQANATPAMRKRQQFKLFAMAALFLLLFYPFPAAMVYYWTLANLFTALQQLSGKMINS